MLFRMTERLESEPANGVNALRRMGAILDCFSKVARTLTLGDIARRTGLPKPTVHRLLLTMREIGFVEQDRERDRYRLGLRLFQLGSTVVANLDLHREAQAHVERLARISGETVHLCIFDGQLAVFVDRKEMDAGPLAMITSIEGAPAYCTGVGKAILAFQPEEVVERVAALGLRRFTENTITDREPLLAELAAIRARGWALDDGEHQHGLRCVAAPIRNAGGRVFASISVSAPMMRIPDRRLPVLAEVVTDTAAQISRQLGWSG